MLKDKKKKDDPNLDTALPQANFGGTQSRQILNDAGKSSGSPGNTATPNYFPVADAASKSNLLSGIDPQLIQMAIKLFGGGGMNGGGGGLLG